MAEDMGKCAADDPHRCQAVTKYGQCLLKSVELPDGTYTYTCKAHGATHSVQSYNEKSYRTYQLERWQARLDQKAESEHIKSLRDEIGILRICLEERLNRCHDATDLILQSVAISDMVLKIEKVVSSCHKLESQMGQLMDKQALLNFAQRVIAIIADNISDENVVNKIADDIIKGLGGNESD